MLFLCPSVLFFLRRPTLSSRHFCTTKNISSSIHNVSNLIRLMQISLFTMCGHRQKKHCNAINISQIKCIFIIIWIELNWMGWLCKWWPVQVIRSFVYFINFFPSLVQRNRDDNRILQIKMIDYVVDSVVQMAWHGMASICSANELINHQLPFDISLTLDFHNVAIDCIIGFISSHRINSMKHRYHF